MRYFETIREDLKKTPNDNITLPRRGTNKSAGYDFYAPCSYKCEPHKITKIWTDVRALMNEDEVLLLDVRSSMGGKFHLANTIGVIDCDYANADNGGNIGIFLVNDTDEVIRIEKDERIAQGIFIKYLVTDNDEPLTNNRVGGFGSTN